MQSFRPFSIMHAVVVLVFVALTTGLVLLRRRVRGTPAAGAIDRGVTAAAVAVWLFTTLVPLLPRLYDPKWSLPLHVCDFATLAVPVALATRWRPAQALAYFWGVGLSSQGFFTPDLQHGPAHVEFWLFWSGHYVVVGGPIYDVAARDYRPDWRDWVIAVAASVAYAVVILPLDVKFDLNYGYIGPSKPGQPSLVDALGPWPRRIVVMWFLALVVMTALLLPWEAARRLGAARASRRPEFT